LLRDFHSSYAANFNWSRRRADNAPAVAARRCKIFGGGVAVWLGVGL
jgi:hypothetical protein